MHTSDPVIALSGGVGGAKLALGLQSVLPAGALHVVANIGDDFEHLGLRISPDIDTLLYALSGRDDPDRGWGRRGESWNFMSALTELGGEDWFQLGDRDLAIHVERTRLLRQGLPLGAVTARLADAFGIPSRLVPATDDLLRTMIETRAERLAFQTWFVARRCDPAVTAIQFEGADQSRLNPAIGAILASPSLRAVVICPSNPYLSIDPILAVPGMRDAIAASPAPVVAVSPLIGGRAVKGPTAKLMADLGLEAGTRAILDHYAGLIDGLLVDQGDVEQAPGRDDIAIAGCDILMRTLEDRERVARAVLGLADRLRRRVP